MASLSTTDMYQGSTIDVDNLHTYLTYLTYTRLIGSIGSVECKYRENFFPHRGPLNLPLRVKPRVKS